MSTLEAQNPYRARASLCELTASRRRPASHSWVAITHDVLAHAAALLA